MAISYGFALLGFLRVVLRLVTTARIHTRQIVFGALFLLFLLDPFGLLGWFMD